MDLKTMDISLLSKRTSTIKYCFTCIECCKYYIAAETAACGHTLCHSCWRGRPTCPSCAAPLERRLLKVNLPLQTRTKHIHNFADKCEKLFQMKLDEILLDISMPEVESVSDPTKNVKDWLADSQNHFSAEMENSELNTQEPYNPIEISSSKIQIHTDSKKSKIPSKVVYVEVPQDDWDKIEQLPDINENTTDKENIVSKNKQGLSLIDENVYTTGNPRRSSRKKDLNQSETTIRGQDLSLERHSSKNSSGGTDLKSNKAKQNWNNVKGMRKEFTKLNKENRSKLNISIEMCKKAQTNVAPQNSDTELQKNTESKSPQPEYIIEDNTPVLDKENPKNTEKLAHSKTLENSPPKDEELKITDNFSKDTSINESGLPLNTRNIVNSHQKDIMIQNNSLQTKSFPANNDKKSNNAQGDNSSKMMFIKKGTLCPRKEEIQNVQTINIDGFTSTDNANNDDIEITIKIGSTQANIVIKKKTNDIQFKEHTDREVQTSLEASGLLIKNSNNNCDLQKDSISIDTQNNVKNSNAIQGNILQKSQSTKKNTASAETATAAQYEITESVEKELSNIMECEEPLDKNKISSKNIKSATVQSQSKVKNKDKTQMEINKQQTLNESQITDDLDIFDNASVKEKTVHLLQSSYHAASEILVPTAKSAKAVNHPEKRDRESNEEEEPSPKKNKSMTEKSTKPDDICGMSQLKSRNNVADNDSMNYDVVMDQVFANIDADIQQSQKDNKVTNCKPATQSKNTPEHSVAKKKLETSVIATQIFPENEPVDKEKYSENLFTVIDKETESHDVITNTKGLKDNGSTQHQIDNVLTPRICQDLVSTGDSLMVQADMDICTPCQEQDDSDKSVVGETPQKNVSFTNPRNKSEADAKSLQRNVSEIRNENDSSSIEISIINVSDSVVETSRDTSIVDAAIRGQTLETPLSINRFVDHITHKSTPVARKSLNFDDENIEDDDGSEPTLCPSSIPVATKSLNFDDENIEDDDGSEQTLCPSSITTQEKESMSEAFKQTQKSPVKRPLTAKNIKLHNLNYCITGSCLSATELTNVKTLCRKYNWKYVEKYSKELTHLVVRVDDENKSQRSVKYMCALAASKWIVSYEWVENCLKTNLVVAENQYEVLDGTGEPGPKRSRLAKKKLFHGITFYCMQPFSLLDVDTLKEMLEASGGRVVNEVKAVTATADAPALLLAEPEHTQEDKFVYLALELNIVPVNYEWALNCLGSYSLCSIHDLLLCPSFLLPKAVLRWSDVMISRDSE